MVNEDALRKKRIYVGILSIGCVVASAILLFYPGNDGLQAALLRVGLLLGAFWLAMPTKTRPAAWKSFSSNWTLVGLIITAIVIPRAKMMFPVIAIIAGIAYFARPRKSQR